MKRVRPFGTVGAVLSFIVALACCSVAEAREPAVPFSAIIPDDWTLLPRAPDTLGRRFVSPSGDAWLWYFAVPVNAQAVRLPQRGKLPTRPGAAIGLSPPATGETGFSIEERC
jgi:hypothetical protein